VTGVVFFVSTLSAMAVMDKFGRKLMRLIGSLVMWVSMVLAGILVAKFRRDWTSHTGVGWAVVTFIWIYVGTFGVSTLYKLQMRHMLTSCLGNLGTCLVDCGF
jgi:MFS family permease